jgi:hypothetical protein
MVALLELLDRHNVPYDKEEVIKRYDIFMKGLRRDPDFDEELRNFNKQKGGQIPIPVKPAEGDFLGPRLRWFVEVMGTPYAQAIVRILFLFLFFVSYLESIPAFGNVLSAGLDMTILGAKGAVKTVQKFLPPLFGLIPFPLAGLVGMSLATLFGMIVWPLVAIVSFSRQDFTVAIEAFLRFIPPPLGDSIADVFLDANRAIAKINDKREKLVKDISNGIEMLIKLSETTSSDVSSKIKEGAKALITETKRIVESPLPPAGATATALSVPAATEFLKRTPVKPIMDMEPTKLAQTIRRKSFGGKRLSKKKTRRSKWPKK